MTLVTAPVAIPIRRILGVPLVTRIVAGSSRAAVNFDPDVETIIFAPQRSATAGFPALLVNDKVHHQREQHCAKQDEPPTLGHVVAEHTDLLSLRGHHV